jgi:predicted ATP-binding protein involved in virulence
MRLRRLTLTNFRGFADLDLTFSERTTVLVGINGAGKTSVLESLASVLDWIVSKDGRRKKYSCEPGDIRSGQRSGKIHLEAAFGTDEQCSMWDLDLSLDDKSSSDVDHEIHPTAVPKVPTYPALGYYPVDRMVRSIDLPVDDVDDTSYPDITGYGLDYSSFFRWYEDREDFENENIRENSRFRDPELEAVRQAIQGLLPEFSNLRVRRSRMKKGEHVPSRLVVNKGSMPFELGQLSHGERGLLAMTGDIARRLGMSGPAGIEPRLRPGIVLIDEVDLHLHPRWQREVLSRLERAFPNVQFIVTTHSPQVLAQLKPESVKLLNNFVLVPTPPTFGRDTNAILSDVMGVDEFPDFSDAWRRKIAEHIDERRWTEARAELQRMAENFGQQDREVLRLRTMIEMLDDSREAAK